MRLAKKETGKNLGQLNVQWVNRIISKVTSPVDNDSVQQIWNPATGSPSNFFEQLTYNYAKCCLI